MRSQSHKQQGEHGLSNVEAVPPVVVGDVTVSLANGVHPSCQGLRHRRGKKRNRALAFCIVGSKN